MTPGVQHVRASPCREPLGTCRRPVTVAFHLRRHPLPHKASAYSTHSYCPYCPFPLARSCSPQITTWHHPLSPILSHPQLCCPCAHWNRTPGTSLIGSAPALPPLESADTQSQRGHEIINSIRLASRLLPRLLSRLGPRCSWDAQLEDREESPCRKGTARKAGDSPDSIGQLSANGSVCCQCHNRNPTTVIHSPA